MQIRKPAEKSYHDYSPSLVEYSDCGNLLQRYIALAVPKLFVYGSENRTLSYLTKLRENDCELVEIPESDHFPFYDNPEAFYRAITAFLEKYGSQ